MHVRRGFRHRWVRLTPGKGKERIPCKANFICSKNLALYLMGGLLLKTTLKTTNHAMHSRGKEILRG